MWEVPEAAGLLSNPLQGTDGVLEKTIFCAASKICERAVQSIWITST
jgi:hypothetical protein